MTWISHNNTLYNLARYTQICKGGPDEILLVDVAHDGDLYGSQEQHYATLEFDSEKERDEFFRYKIGKRLGI